MTKKNNLEYDGEFGFEMQAVLPYAYYLYKNNRLGKTAGAKDSKCLYYFSQNHEEKYAVRRYVPPNDPVVKNNPNQTEHCFKLNTSEWTPPPYKQKYSNTRFLWEKEPLIISNKFNIEWNLRAFNYINLPTLEKIIQLLQKKYTLIYSRPKEKDCVNDHNEILEYGDFKLLEKFPNVLTMQELHKNNQDLSYNTLQLMVHSNCNKFISVQGGNSVLASYFGGTNIIYAIKGQELSSGDYCWYSLYSKARICPCMSYKSLLKSTDTLYGSERSALSKDCQFKKQFMKYNLEILKRRCLRSNILLRAMKRLKIFSSKIKFL